MKRGQSTVRFTVAGCWSEIPRSKRRLWCWAANRALAEGHSKGRAARIANVVVFGDPWVKRRKKG